MKRFRFVTASILALVLLIALGGSASSAPAPEKTPAHVPGTVIVKFKDAAPQNVRTDVIAAHGLTEKGRIYGTDVLVLEGQGQSAGALVRALARNPNVAYAELDYLADANWTPNDPSFSAQWALPKVQAPAAWDYARGTSAVLIAVVDTGVDLSHPDLAGKVRTDIDWDFVNNDATAQDDNGHGTHLAGTVAAATNNGTGIAGMCPNCSILPVKVLNASGSGSYSAIASGIRYAADKGAKVINLSLGGSSGATTLSDAVVYANGKGALQVCAVGGSNSSTPSYPAYYSQCVAVAATDQNDNKASFSSYGTWVDTSAPGVSIYSTYLNGGYATLSGASMATAHAAGLAGLLFSQGRSQADVRTRLTGSAYTDPVNSTLIPRRINALKAVSL